MSKKTIQIKMTLREKFSWFRSDLKNNIRHCVWKLSEHHKIWIKERLVRYPWQSTKKGIVATIQVDEYVYSLFHPLRIKTRDDVKIKFLECHFESDGNESVGWAISRACDVDFRRNEVQFAMHEPEGGAIVISTLIFNDYSHIHPWLHHYRKLGVNQFLLYYNGSRIPESVASLAAQYDDVVVIPWPLRYAWWSRHKGRKTFHVAQPLQIMHSVLLLRKMLSHGFVLTVDVDEFILSKPFSHLTQDNPQEIGFANIWATGHEGFPRGDFKMNVDFNIESVDRRKVLRSIQFPGLWKIHGSNDGGTNVKDGGMLHFFNMPNEYGHGRFAEITHEGKYLDFLSSQHVLREHWESLYS